MSVVLLVLSRAEDRERLGVVLGQGGFSVHNVDDASEVVVVANACRASAVIVSTDLPDDHCRQVCRTLRGDPATTGMPLLLLAGDERDPRILDGLHSGADDYVVRLCPEEVLIGRLRRLIRDRQLALSAVINEQLAQVGRLLAGIVHEIRSPLTVIRGQLELLRMALGAEAHLDRYLEPIHRNVELMRSRLDHLMATVRGGGLAREQVDVNELVEEAAELFQKGADPRRRDVRVALNLDDHLPPVSVDPGRLIQVLINLLANAREAILATERPGTIRIQTRLAADQGQSWLLLVVEDDGPGIAEDQLDRIFEPFFTTKADGTGYGLYLSSEILREHGGRLTACRSTLGGACFTIWLPTPNSAADAESPKPGPGA